VAAIQLYLYISLQPKITNELIFKLYSYKAGYNASEYEVDNISFLRPPTSISQL